MVFVEADLIPVLVEPKLETWQHQSRSNHEKNSKPKLWCIHGQLAEMDAIHEIAR
jgi:hypothetical protein